MAGYFVSRAPFGACALVKRHQFKAPLYFTIKPLLIMSGTANMIRILSAYALSRRRLLSCIPQDRTASSCCSFHTPCSDAHVVAVVVVLLDETFGFLVSISIFAGASMAAHAACRLPAKLCPVFPCHQSRGAWTLASR